MGLRIRLVALERRLLRLLVFANSVLTTCVLLPPSLMSGSKFLQAKPEELVSPPAQANGHPFDPSTSKPQHSPGWISKQDTIKRLRRLAVGAFFFLYEPVIPNSRELRQWKSSSTNMSSTMSRETSTRNTTVKLVHSRELFVLAELLYGLN